MAIASAMQLKVLVAILVTLMAILGVVAKTHHAVTTEIDRQKSVEQAINDQNWKTQAQRQQETKAH